jgi:rod shape-determining protein MreC
LPANRALSQTPFDALSTRDLIRGSLSIKALFVRESGAGYLLTGLALVSLILITLDTSTRLLESVRSAIGTVVSPLVVVAETPYLLGDSLGEVVASRENLHAINAQLERRVLELSQISQQFLAMKQENQRLRELLGSRARLPTEVLIAELIGVVPNPNTHQVIIDKGSDAGVTVGQAVIDAQGLFGQIVEVSQFTSRVLLITDASHALPVQVNRNGVRSVAGGTGHRDTLELENVPVTADIREGDLIETSGLAGRFPVGYPVGYVASVEISETSAYATVAVRPTASLDRTRHVLVLFPQTTSSDVLDDTQTLQEMPSDPPLPDDPVEEGA